MVCANRAVAGEAGRSSSRVAAKYFTTEARRTRRRSSLFRFPPCSPCLCGESVFSFRQARESSQLLQILPQRLRGCAPEDLAPAAKLLVRQDARLSAQDRARFDLGVIAHSDLPSEEAIVPDAHAARESNLGGHNNVLTEGAVVADVHQVIQLCARTYDRP